jgi:hypothetical protein
MDPEEIKPVETAEEARELTLENALSIESILRTITNSAKNGNSSTIIYGYIKPDIYQSLLKEGFSISEYRDTTGSYLLIKWINQ